MAVLEAMASKLPIVASRVGEVPSLVGVENGLLADPNDVCDLKRCLIHLIVNPAAAKTMGEKGYHLVKTRFSAERMAQDYMSIYQEVMRRKKKQFLAKFEKRTIEGKKSLV